MGLKGTIMELIRNRDRDGLRLDILRALTRITEAAPEAVALVRDLLENYVEIAGGEEKILIERLLGRRHGGCDEA